MSRHDHLFPLAKSLARPVTRGYISLTTAHVALLNDVLIAERKGDLGDFKASDIFNGLKHILGLWVKIHTDRRAVAAMHIEQRLKPLIALHKPVNVLLAEAHDVNGLEHFPLAEPEVADIAATEMWFSLPSRPHHRGP